MVLVSQSDVARMGSNPEGLALIRDMADHTQLHNEIALLQGEMIEYRSQLHDQLEMPDGDSVRMRYPDIESLPEEVATNLGMISLRASLASSKLRVAQSKEIGQRIAFQDAYAGRRITFKSIWKSQNIQKLVLQGNEWVGGDYVEQASGVVLPLPTSPNRLLIDNRAKKLGRALGSAGTRHLVTVVDQTSLEPHVSVNIDYYS